MTTFKASYIDEYGNKWEMFQEHEELSDVTEAWGQVATHTSYEPCAPAEFFRNDVLVDESKVPDEVIDYLGPRLEQE